MYKELSLCTNSRGEVVGAMERSGQADEFRSNLHKGGTARQIEVDKKIKSAALEATKLMGLTVAGVNLLLSSRGPLVIEVNSSPGLQGIEYATKLDIAGKIIEAAEKKVNKSVKDKAKAKLKKRKKKVKRDDRE